MIPEDYRKERKFNRAKNLFYSYSTYLASFTLGYLILGPAAHEFSHLIFLELFSCPFTSLYNFNLISGFTGTLKLNCSLDNYSRLVFYLSGYSATAITGIILLAASRFSERFDKILLSTGTGCMISILTTLTMKGDLHSITGFDGFGDIFFVILFIFIVSIATVIALEPYIQNGRKGTKTSP